MHALMRRFFSFTNKLRPEKILAVAAVLCSSCVLDLSSWFLVGCCVICVFLVGYFAAFVGLYVFLVGSSVFPCWLVCVSSMAILVFKLVFKRSLK